MIWLSSAIFGFLCRFLAFCRFFGFLQIFWLFAVFWMFLDFYGFLAFSLAIGIFNFVASWYNRMWDLGNRLE
jgi:hypothetical protein